MGAGDVRRIDDEVRTLALAYAALYDDLLYGRQRDSRALKLREARHIARRVLGLSGEGRGR